MGTTRLAWGGVALALLVGCGESVTGPSDPASPDPEPPPAHPCTCLRKALMDDFPAAVADAELALVVDEPTVVEIREDRGADGTTDGCLVYLYTAAGFRTLTADDEDNDLIPDRMHHVYEHDEVGNPILYRSDSDGDQEFECYGGSVYDEQGNTISSWRDDDHDGVIDLMGYATFDDDGNRLSQWHDEDGDGLADDLTTFTYDEHGHRLWTYSDFDVDGTIDHQSLNVWNDQGLRVEHLIEELVDSALVVTEHHRMSYDEQGRETSWEVDYDGDGLADARSTVAYAGALQTTAIDFEADGLADNLEYAVYGFFGDRKQPLRIETDDYADGGIDQVRTWERDEAGRTLVFEMDHDGDGEVSFRQTYLRVP